MNHIIEEEFPLQETQSLRYDLLNVLTDADLAFRLPGDNLTLGELCQEIGNIEHSYIQSFITLEQDWSYRNADPKPTTSVADLKIWYRTLDEAFETVLRGFSDDDLHSTEIHRGKGIRVSAQTQFEIYREATMMFYAKASVYLKGLQKSVSDQWEAWIG